ncbi:MAG: SMC-Scp complex subunit ScpB [Planctomycetes bacterium]|nr:SMC-Scp complex subunit ScpB [Planctomycetota bacterium]
MKKESKKGKGKPAEKKAATEEVSTLEPVAAPTEEIEITADDQKMIARESAKIGEGGLADIESVVDLHYFDDVARLEEPESEEFPPEPDEDDLASDEADFEDSSSDDGFEDESNTAAENTAVREDLEDEAETALAPPAPKAGEAALNPSEPPGSHLSSVIEALLFVAKEPLTAKRLSNLLSGIDTAIIRKAIAELEAEYAESKRAFQIVKLAGGYQLLTKPRFAEYVKQLQRVTQESKITPAALQTLAMVAYKQPVTRSEIDAIRGADSSTHVRTLLDKNLIRPVGRKKIPGYPLMYGTTKRFLEMFGMASIKDLPQTTEFATDKSN